MSVMKSGGEIGCNGQQMIWSESPTLVKILIAREACIS